MNMSTPATPAGTTRETYLSGTNAPSRSVSALRAARQERVDDLRRGRIAGVHGVHPEPRPDWSQAAKGFAPGEAPAAVDALGFRGRQEAGDVVAVLGVARREDL